MSIDIIKQRIGAYRCNTPSEEEQALKEITQEVILMSLSRQNFFSVAEFHGGTALRILYELQRFSEDLDFALLKPDANFTLTRYLDAVSTELRAFGYEFEVKDRSQVHSTVKKAFLKDDSIGKIFVLKRSGVPKKLTIKLEVDSNPPLGAETEIKYLDFPYPFGIRATNLSSSFSGKLHALLCRSYVKGRDWYDFVWYVAQKSGVNFLLLKNALKQNGPWKGQEIDLDVCWLVNALGEKIRHIDWKKASLDVAAFLRAEEQESLQIWTQDFFLYKLTELENHLLSR